MRSFFGRLLILLLSESILLSLEPHLLETLLFLHSQLVLPLDLFDLLLLDVLFLALSQELHTSGHGSSLSLLLLLFDNLVSHFFLLLLAFFGLDLQTMPCLPLSLLAHIGLILLLHFSGLHL